MVNVKSRSKADNVSTQSNKQFGKIPRRPALLVCLLRNGWSGLYRRGLCDHRHFSTNFRRSFWPVGLKTRQGGKIMQSVIFYGLVALIIIAGFYIARRNDKTSKSEK